MSDLELDIFEVDEAELGTMPSFSPFPSGEYKNLEAVLEVKTVGKKGDGLWKFASVKLSVSSDTIIDLTSDDDKEPKEGDTMEFTYDIIRTDKDTKEEYACHGKHTTPSGTARDFGGFTKLVKDFGDMLDTTSPKEIAEQLGEGVTFNCDIVTKESSATNDAGEPYVNSFINNAELD